MDTDLTTNSSLITKTLPPPPRKNLKINSQANLRLSSNQKASKNAIQKLNYYSSKNTTNTAKILIVDSDPMKKQYYSSLATKLGFSVVAIGDGESGFKTAISQPFDLIITNIFLSQMSGKVMVQKLRKREAYSIIKIIGILPNRKILKNPEILKNFNDYIEEPVTFEKMIMMLQKHLKPSGNSPEIMKISRQQEINKNNNGIN